MFNGSPPATPSAAEALVLLMSNDLYYSQWGEDLAIWEFFLRAPDGFFIEVGANEPSNLSQTFLLEQKGWKGILVEPQPACCERLRQRRPRSTVVQAACGPPAQKGKALFRIASHNDRSSLAGFEPDEDVEFTGTIEVDLVTLDEVLERAGNPRVDFLSIDVEGGELEVLSGFSLARHAPALVLVEDHVETLRLHSYMKSRGYKLVRRTGSNNWYVPASTPFPVGWGERLRLLRKMQLGTPLRKLKRLLKRRRRRPAKPACPRKAT
jgi:FkbM family methyltransferase